MSQAGKMQAAARAKLCTNLVDLLGEDEHDPQRQGVADMLLLRYNDGKRAVYDIVSILAHVRGER